MSAVTLRKAHAVHPIAAVQTEYPLWTRNPEIALLQACKELDTRDIRRTMPCFDAANYAANLKLLPGYMALAKGEHIIPIPGTTSLAHLQEDMAAVNVKLEPALMARLEALINQNTVAGARYNAQSQSEVDTEVFCAALVQGWVNPTELREEPNF